MQSEFGKLMKAVIVSSSSDINQGVLQKLNKGPLVYFLSNTVNLMDCNMKLCKSAASKTDQMKTDEIDMQLKAAYEQS